MTSAGRFFLCELVCIFLALAETSAALEILIDVGHDPEASGAVGASGQSEFAINSLFARELTDALTTSGHNVEIFKALESIPLTERVAILNEMGGDLLISVHHDSVQEQHLSTTEAFGGPTDYTDAASGFSIFVSNEDPGYSVARRAGSEIGLGLVRDGFTPNLYHNRPLPGENRHLLNGRVGLYVFDELAVLRRVSTPGILIEVSVIKNPVDEARAWDANFRANFIASIARSLDLFER